ncbi:MAG: hypothetical protein RBT63_08580, partial [Bdellovibrionales bacterium]|nr:hypothetical protein [Bdellovibrionales bacterium]
MNLLARIRQHFKSHSETKLTWVAFPSLAVALAFTLSACGPATSSITLTGLSETGFQTPDGRAHTGADASDDLEILKNELVEQNKDLARRILSARIARVQTRIFVYMTLQDSLQKNERVSFEFDDSSDSKTATPAAGAKGTDTVRFKSVRGLFSDGSRSSYELSLLCERAEASSALANTACRTATVALKEFQKGTSTELARAGLILRNREVLVLSKALSPNLKNMLLKQVLTSLQTVRTASLESFEVAWGRSGFALHSDELKNLQLCPVGRLVETNESDDPLQLTCSGKNQPREIEGRMLGNTTHGELFLELISTSESLFSKEKERVYLMIRHKRAVDAKTRPQNDPKQTPSVPSGTTTTVQTPAQAPTTGAPEGADADEESDEYESLFLEDEQPATPDVPEKPDQTPHELTSKNGQTRSLVPAQPGDGKTGWLV